MSEPFWLSRDEVRELDRRAIEEFGMPGIVLMENAGRGAAELLMRLNPEEKPVTILCGPGNNGGDGFVMARHLENHNYPVHIWLAIRGETAIDVEANLSPDCRTNYLIAKRAGIAIELVRGSVPEWQREMIRSDLALHSNWIVDSVFGTGLRGAIGHPFDEMIAAANLSRKPILAIDIPSGLDCDKGIPLGITIQATHTATFVALKKGFLQPSAKAVLGDVHVIDIGAPRKLVNDFQAMRC